MSLSKLESLPNEILSDLIEKYINGVDIVMAFNYQLNRRFDGLITRCHQLYFNFIRCQKDEFRFCMGLLPAYINKIEGLAISEQDTPGQVHAFLSFFPTFKPFKRLRKLYFHYNIETIDQVMAVKALHSLADTAIETLSIKVTNGENQSVFNDYFFDLLRLKTLKRLCFFCESNYINWESLTSISSNIKYLTIFGMGCKLRCLGTICQCAPSLKYLNIGLFDTENSVFYEPKHSFMKNIRPIFFDLAMFIYVTLWSAYMKNIRPMLALRTLILSFQEGDQSTLDMLAPYLNTMPVLNHLEINGNRELVNAYAWEMLLEISLPLLTHLTLRMSVTYLRNVDIENVKASFQNSFWIGKKNFNIIITSHRDVDINRFSIYFKQNLHPYHLNLPVFQCLIAPDRTVDDCLINVDEIITSLRLFDGSDTELFHYYFNNVKCLTVDYMSRSLFNWMATYVNCSRIAELIITPSYKKTEEFTSLLAWIPNMNSLHINFDLLINEKDSFVEGNNYLKRLDLSVCKHVFDKKSIIIIAKLFPSLEHIKINTQNLYNIPILKMYLPHLRSLTFHSTVASFLTSYNNEASNSYTNLLQQKTKFLFQIDENFISVWIDQAMYEESYWQTFRVKSPQSTAASIISRVFSSLTTKAATSSSDDNKKKKRKFPLLKFLKK